MSVPTLKKTSEKGLGRDNTNREKIRVISDHQIGEVIRAYLKNRRDTFAQGAPTSEEAEVKDQTFVSDQGKRILLERMGQRVAKKAKTDTSSIPDGGEG
jgi:hypothetical protein